MGRHYPLWAILETLYLSRPMLAGELWRQVRAQAPVSADGLSRMLTKLGRCGMLRSSAERVVKNGRPPLLWRLSRAGEDAVGVVGVAPGRYRLGWRQVSALARAAAVLRFCGGLRPKVKRERMGWYLNRALEG